MASIPAGQDRTACGRHNGSHPHPIPFRSGNNVTDNESQDRIEGRQLDVIQRLGRIGYWEFAPAARTIALPEASHRLLAEILGRSTADCPSFLQALPDGEGERFQRCLDEAIAGAAPFAIELDLATASGGSARLSVRGSTVGHDAGVACVAGTFQDITDERRAEEQLLRQRDVLKTIIDNFPGAISLCDTDLRFTAYNEQFIELLEFPRSLFEEGWVHFADLARFNAERGEYGPGDPEEQVRAMTARAHDFRAHHIERQRPNGRWLEVRGTPIPSGGFVTSYIDITERKRVEAELVRAREAAEARREQVANLLDHSGQGFLSFGSDLVVDAECSRACAAMLGASPAGRSAADALFAGDAARTELLAAAVPMALAERDPWRRDTVLSLLPAEFTRGARLLRAEYKPLENGRLMVVLTDVTEERRLQGKVESEHRRLEMIVAAVTDGRDFFDTLDAYRDFIANGLPALVETPADAEAAAREAYRQTHTFKGLMNQFSFPRTPIALHDLESRLEHLRTEAGGAPLRRIAEAVRAVPLLSILEEDLQVLRDALGPEFLDRGNRFALSAAQAEQMRQLADRLLRGERIDAAAGGMREFLLAIHRLHEVPFRDILAGFDRVVRQTAARAEREVAPLTVRGSSEIRIDPLAYRPFLRSLVHVFRNAVVHGIEDPDARAAAGKARQGTISCTIAVRADRIELSIEDDGAGIDTEALRRRAVAARLAPPGDAGGAPDEHILDLVFLDNLGTRPEVTELAGRGVGLAAVRNEVLKLKGEVTARTTAGRGTQFLFTLPLQTDIIQASETPCQAGN